MTENSHDHHDHECDCGHGHEDGACACDHDHAHGCDGEHGHEHAHVEKSVPAYDFDVEKMGMGWEGVCPCGCGGMGHYAGAPGTGLGGVEAETSDSIIWRTWVDGNPDTYEEFQQGYAFDYEGNLLGEEEEEELPEPDFVEFDYVRSGVGYHVRRWGKPGEIPLLLLHGFMQTGATWAAVAPRLAQDHCLYAIDLVGHGQSDKPRDPEAYTISAQACAVAGFIRNVILPQNADAAVSAGRMPVRRVHVLGYSMGGRIALDLALHHSRVVFSLMLESAGIGPADEGERAQLAARSAEWARMLREDGMEAFVDYWETLPLFESQRNLPEELRAAVRAERLANDPEAMALCVENAGQHTMSLADENMGRLCLSWTPVLYLAGTRDEKYLALAERFTKEGFDAKPVMAGHDLHLEAPGLFCDALGPHLRANEIRGI